MHHPRRPVSEAALPTLQVKKARNHIWGFKLRYFFTNELRVISSQRFGRKVLQRWGYSLVHGRRRNQAPRLSANPDPNQEPKWARNWPETLLVMFLKILNHGGGLPPASIIGSKQIPNLSALWPCKYY